MKRAVVTNDTTTLSAVMLPYPESESALTDGARADFVVRLPLMDLNRV